MLGRVRRLSAVMFVEASMLELFYVGSLPNLKPTTTEWCQDRDGDQFKTIARRGGFK